MLDTIYTLRFLYLLTQPWDESAAYKQGIIDKNGKQLKNRSQLKTEAEKDSFTRFHQLVFNIKRLLEKFPLGKTTIAKYATALYLIKEEFGVNLENTFLDFINDNDIALFEINQHDNVFDDNKYIRMFGVNFIKEGNELTLYEDMNVTAGIEMTDKKMKMPDDKFAGHDVFTVDSDSFHKSRFGKKPYARFKTYVGEDDVGKSIREYAIKYPNKTILLKNEQDGSMIFFRKK